MSNLQKMLELRSSMLEKLGSREKKKKNKCMDRQSFINTSERLRV